MAARAVGVDVELVGRVPVASAQSDPRSTVVSLTTGPIRAGEEALAARLGLTH